MKQHGAVLITALALLVVLTILGLQAMRNSSLEERMAGNVRAENIAFQAAEAGLRGAELWIGKQTSKPAAKNDGSSGVWKLDSPDPNTGNNKAWWQDWASSDWESDGTAYADAGKLEVASGVTLTAAAPRYVIEERQEVADSIALGQPQDFAGRQFYQVTSRGRDVSGRINVVLRTTYVRRY